MLKYHSDDVSIAAYHIMISPSTIGHRKMIAARSYVWWPKIDADIKKMVISCIPHQEIKKAPPLYPWI